MSIAIICYYWLYYRYLNHYILHILNPGIVHPKLTLIGATPGAKAPT